MKVSVLLGFYFIFLYCRLVLSCLIMFVAFSFFSVVFVGCTTVVVSRPLKPWCSTRLLVQTLTAFTVSPFCWGLILLPHPTLSCTYWITIFLDTKDCLFPPPPQTLASPNYMAPRPSVEPYRGPFVLYGHLTNLFVTLSAQHKDAP